IDGIGSKATTHFFDSPENAIEILEELAPGDVVLVKASRAERLEFIAEKIMEFWQGRTEGENS
ncbi:MAG: UDP-N-acetylmuramoyl-tripeptide--D-alanyl-D-alanine ligase, partial [Actinomycetota bacterium]